MTLEFCPFVHSKMRKKFCNHVGFFIQNVRTPCYAGHRLLAQYIYPNLIPRPLPSFWRGLIPRPIPSFGRGLGTRLCISILASQDCLIIICSTLPYFCSLLFHQMLQWVCSHMADGEKKTALSTLLDLHNYRVRFQKYNWDLNSNN